MVRTRADSSARKAVAAKAPRKQVGTSSRAGSSSKIATKKASYSSGGGGNPLRVCDIPSWQKGIGEFYPKLKKDNQAKDDAERSDTNKDGPCLLSASSDCQQNNMNGDDKVQSKCVMKGAEIGEPKQGPSSSMEETEENTLANGTKERLIPQPTVSEGSKHNSDDGVIGDNSSSVEESQPEC